MLFFTKGYSSITKTWRLYCDGFPDRAKFEEWMQASRRMKLQEVPYQCIRKLYPRTKFEDGMSEAWNGK